MPESRYTDAQLAKLAETPFAGGRGLAGDLAAELLAARARVVELEELTASNHRAYLTAIGVTEENPNV